MEQKDQQKDYYTILNVAKFSDVKVCKKAFNKLALTCHPDKITHDSESKERLSKQWREIDAAHKVLSDEKKKEEYDTQLRSGCSHDVAAALFTDFSPLKDKEGFEFFSGVKEYIKHQQALLNQYWQGKDLGRFAENYAKLRQFSTFLEEEVDFRKGKEFFSEMTYESSYTYYTEVEFRVGENPNALQFLVQKGKSIFINLDADGKSLTFTVRSNESSRGESIRLNVEDFRYFVGNSVKFEKIEKQIGQIVNFLKTNKALKPSFPSPSIESDDILLSDEEEKADSEEFDHSKNSDSDCNVEALPHWKKCQLDWVKFIFSHYPSVDAEKLVGRSEVVNQQIQESVSNHDAKAANEQQINSWHAPLKKQLELMEEKYGKKLEYASTAHRLWASEKILTDYNEKLVFSFNLLDQKNNYNQIAKAPVNPEQSAKLSELCTGHTFLQNESTIALAIHVLFQNISELFKRLVNGANDTEPTKETLLIENGEEEGIENLTGLSRNNSTPQFFQPVDNEKVMDEEDAPTEAKKLLYEYIYNRGFEKKYTGSMFGFKKEEKMKAAELLYDVLYLNGDKHQLFEDPKLLGALKQGRLGNIAKEAVENIENELKDKPLNKKSH